MTKKLVFVRHGQSEWNLANKFTGWVDVNLSDKGVEEAKEAGRKIKEAGIKFDIAYTSILKRAIKTCNFALEYSDQMYVPVVKSWRLNERHYGALQGLNKKETAEKYGDEQVHIWRRSYDTLPPALSEEEAKISQNISNLTKEIESLDQEIASVKDSNKDYAEKLENLNNKAKTYSDSINNIDGEINSLEASKKEKSTQKDEISNKLKGLSNEAQELLDEQKSKEEKLKNLETSSNTNEIEILNIN